MSESFDKVQLELLAAAGPIRFAFDCPAADGEYLVRLLGSTLHTVNAGLFRGFRPGVLFLADFQWVRQHGEAGPRLQGAVTFRCRPDGWQTAGGIPLPGLYPAVNFAPLDMLLDLVPIPRNAD